MWGTSRLAHELVTIWWTFRRNGLSATTWAAGSATVCPLRVANRLHCDDSFRGTNTHGPTLVGTWLWAFSRGPERCSDTSSRALPAVRTNAETFGTYPDRDRRKARGRRHGNRLRRTTAKRGR
jgi:hypothetical protein